MSREPRGLGKGLSALLGETIQEQQRQPVGYVNKEIAGAKTPERSADILRVPIDQIEPNPYQPRLTFDKDALDELSQSIRTLGLIQPITLRKISSDRYQIISGERRYRASRQAGLTTIPAYVREADDQGMLEMAIVENVQRENLDPIEVALSYQRLIDECSLTQDQMAERVGKKRATVANSLRLLKLPAKVQHDIKVGIISAGHAKAILGVEDPGLQEQLCDLTVRDGLSVRELESLVRKMVINPRAAAPGTAAVKKARELPESYRSLQEKFGSFAKSEVAVHRSQNGKGSITIKFNSDEEVTAFLSVLAEKGL